VEAVLAQRLVRVICRECKAEVDGDGGWLVDFGVDARADAAYWRGLGCGACRGTGYRGRVGIYELLVMDDDLRAELPRRRDAGELRRLAIAKGMRTLRQDGLRQVLAGVTTPEEVLRVTRG
jgi:type II secretory ATPase GspE/PulE/Tfp pilus assembly ATPase PilB-like protein